MPHTACLCWCAAAGQQQKGGADNQCERGNATATPVERSHTQSTIPTENTYRQSFHDLPAILICLSHSPKLPTQRPSKTTASPAKRQTKQIRTHFREQVSSDQSEAFRK